MQPRITLESPFPPEALSLAWAWLNEHPERNFDDYGPHTLTEFIEEMERRAMTERTWAVRKDGQLAGIIGYLPITDRLGTFHGICFARSAWGRETTMTAVCSVIAQLFKEGVKKICASYFADNEKIRRFLSDLGAEDEGLLHAHTMRDGIPISMRVVAIFPEVFECHLAAR